MLEDDKTGFSQSQTDAIKWYKTQTHVPEPIDDLNTLRKQIETLVDEKAYRIWGGDHSSNREFPVKGTRYYPPPKPISPLGENRKSRRKRQFATKNTKSTLKQKPLSLGAIMALENLQRMFEDKNENI